MSGHLTDLFQTWYDSEHDWTLQFDPGLNELDVPSRSQDYGKARSRTVILWYSCMKQLKCLWWLIMLTIKKSCKYDKYSRRHFCFYYIFFLFFSFLVCLYIYNFLTSVVEAWTWTRLSSIFLLFSLGAASLNQNKQQQQKKRAKLRMNCCRRSSYFIHAWILNIIRAFLHTCTHSKHNKSIPFGLGGYPVHYPQQLKLKCYD